MHHELVPNDEVIQRMAYARPGDVAGLPESLHGIFWIDQFLQCVLLHFYCTTCKILLTTLPLLLCYSTASSGSCALSTPVRTSIMTSDRTPAHPSVHPPLTTPLNPPFAATFASPSTPPSTQPIHSPARSLKGAPSAKSQLFTALTLYSYSLTTTIYYTTTLYHTTHDTTIF